MIYETYIEKAKKLVIQRDEDTGMYYLDPNWLHILYTSKLPIEDIYEPYINSKHDIEDVLKLEVERRNIRNNHTNKVVDWIYNIISTTIDPAILQEENEFLKNTMDYLQLNHALQGKEEELKKWEESLGDREAVTQFVPNGLVFSKKE